MQLEGKRIILTGAAGGIGQALAHALAARGAWLAMVGRSQESLRPLCTELTQRGCNAVPIIADLTDATACERVVRETVTELGGVDLLINNAGISSFHPLMEEDPERLDAIIRLNLGAPILLSRALLPRLLAQGSGQIVNIGSTFGSIGFAWFAAYSASKAGLRGFSEALRRELADSGVGVTYIAPRAVHTPLNSEATLRMAAAVKMNMDSPEWVADRIVAAIERGRKDVYLGWPESLFVRINALLPRLVDAALAKQNRIMERFAREY
jgi:short-subunit dehydrogenase